MSPTARSADAAALACLVLVAGALRGLTLAFQGLSYADPWRHLLLVANLREGLGFTLFDGQPYLWYSPVWYRFAAAFGSLAGPAALAAALSCAAVPLFYVWLRRGGGLEPVWAFTGAAPLAAFGPLLTDTCHAGSEGFALVCVCAALAISTLWRPALSGPLAGLLFGIASVARLNMIFGVFLCLPAYRRPRSLAGFGAGFAVPLLWTWWRNHRIVTSYDYVFTWDGLATRAADFDWLSTFMIQRHPAVTEALRRLHQQVVPVPEWWAEPELLVFLVLAALCLGVARRPHLALAGFATLGYLLLFDATLSAHFFRLYLGLLPAAFAALAVVARDTASRGRAGRIGAVTLVVLVLLLGVGPGLRRVQGAAELMSIDRVTPPESLLPGDAYMVNSGFYHPESLAFRFAGKRFIGMPLDPEGFAEFRASFPTYGRILWHGFSVQDSLARHLAESGYRPLATAVNRFGYRYTVLEPPPAAAADGPAKPAP